MAQIFNANVEVLGSFKSRDFDFQPSVLKRQNAATNPGTPQLGDRYIVGDKDNLHASFGTITGVANGDIVEYDGSAFIIFFDASTSLEGALAWSDLDDKFYRWTGTVWSAGSGEDLADLSDTTFAGLAGGHIMIYDGTDSWDNKAMSGDITISTAGVAAIGTSKVLTAMINDDAVDKAKIAADVAGLGLSQAAGGELDVNVDDVTVEISTDTLQVKALGIDTAQLAADAVDKTKIAADIAGLGLGQAAGGELDVNVDDSSIEITTDTLNVKALGITDGMLAGSISFSKLADNANIARLDQTETVAAVWDFGSNLPTLTTDPTTANQAVRKSYVDGLLNGLSWKSPARVATSSNTTLSGPGATIDGVTMATDDRVLLTGQTTPSQNGLWLFKGAASAMVRPEDFNGTGEADSAAVFISEGTSGDEGFTQNTDSVTIDTTSQTWVQFTGTGSIEAGTGLTKSGSTINAIGGEGITANADDLAIDHDGEGLTFATSQLALELDGATLSKSASGVKVADGGVDTTQLAADAVDKTKIAADIAGLGLGQAAGGELDVNVDDTTVEISTDTLQVKALGIDTAQLAADAVDSAKLDWTDTGLRGLTEAWTNAQGTTKTVTHNWSTQTIMVEVVDTNFVTVFVDEVKRATTNTVTLTAVVAPPAGQDYTVYLREIKTNS